MTVKKPSKPTHRVFAVRKTGNDKLLGRNRRSLAESDGKGFSLKFNLMPLGEADIVVREIARRG